MYYLYHSKSVPGFENPLSDYTMIDVLPYSKNRKYLDKLDFLWSLITFGRYKKIVVLNSDNKVVHTSRVIGKCVKFPFLSRTSAEIGPCATNKEFRGQGIYPNVLKHILSNGGWDDYYMLVHNSNTASIRGIEKAGFQRVGAVEKRHGIWVKCAESYE